MDLGGKVASMAAEKDGLAKVIKESESWLEESELRAAKEREADRELKEELIFYKKETMK